jgi:hypothetical protein
VINVCIVIIIISIFNNGRPTERPAGGE